MISTTAPRDNFDELFDELQSLIAERATGDMAEDRRARLETLVVEHPAASQLYVDFLADTFSLH